jgi:hypothetical protein
MLRAPSRLVFAVLAACLAASQLPGAVGAAATPILPHPIESRQQTSVHFGERSHWLQPWRGYLDTVPASRLLGAIGINFNVEPRDAPATARLLARAGFRRARVEVGWSSFSYADTRRLTAPLRLRRMLLALKAAHIRPLILLNANDQGPCPLRRFDVHVVTAAASGAMSVRLDSSSRAAIVPGRSGLTIPAGSKAAAILFTSVAPDGTAALSKPLPQPLAPGTYPALTLRYPPFSRPRLADGGPNPAFERTLRGWLGYVGAVVENARRILGSTNFDVEIWNELSFGSDFLDINRYYESPVDHGVGDTTDAVLRRTVAWLRMPRRGLGGVGIGNGFASQRPWDSGTGSPVGLTAIDKHPYPPPPKHFPADAAFNGIKPLDALGHVDASPDGAGAWQDRFVPSYTAFLPEYSLTAIQTETLVRDISPITTTVYGVPHGRFTHPSGGAPPQLWITEFNIDPGEALPHHRGSPNAVERHLQAKSALRALVAFVGAGARALYYFAARDPHFGLIDPRKRGGGKTIGAVGRLVRGFRGAISVGRTRPLELLEIGDFSGARQFDGDGTPAHPPLYDRDVLAFFPFELAAGRYVIGTYVMTRDVAHRYAAGADRPAAFDLPPRRFRLTIGGLGGCDARVAMTDPLLATNPAVHVVSCTSRALTVEVALTDSPRLLRIERR